MPVIDQRYISEAGAVGWEGHTSMSLRDAAALAALPAVINVCEHNIREPDETMEQRFARKAWEVADAFIAARETKEDDE